MTRTALCCVASLFALTLGLRAPYAQPAASAVADSGGLPPFLAKMQRQPLEVRVVEKDGAGGLRPAPAGLKATVTILAGGGKVKDYVAQSAESRGCRSNQRSLYLCHAKNPPASAPVPARTANCLPRRAWTKLLL